MGRFLTISLFVVLASFLFLNRSQTFSLVSPIPRIFGTAKTNISNQWFPDLKPYQNKPDFHLSSKAAILVNYDTGEVIFAKDPRQKLPIASTVKIMTALVALENARLTDIYTVSQKAAKIGENSMGLVESEKLSLEELLYGLMLVSGNDAAVAIAEGVAGSEDRFVQLMNQEAKNLGLVDTQFINSSGLDDDNNNDYSTVYDLVTIAHYIWQNYPKFREISSTYHKVIEATATHQSFDLYNDTNLLTTYPGVTGIKPGFTWEAGLCLVTYSENGGKKLLGIILGSTDRRGEMKELLDYGFARYDIKIDHPALDL